MDKYTKLKDIIKHLDSVHKSAEKASDARFNSPLGTSRAKTTTLNARLNAYAESRDSVIQELITELVALDITTTQGDKEMTETLQEVRKFFKLVNINVKFRRVPNGDNVIISGDINNELVKPYVDGIMHITYGGDYLTVITSN